MQILGFYNGGYESYKNSDFEAKINVVNSVSGEKLHDLEIVCTTPPPAYGPELAID